MDSRAIQLSGTDIAIDLRPVVPNPLRLNARKVAVSRRLIISEGRPVMNQDGQREIGNLVSLVGLSVGFSSILGFLFTNQWLTRSDFLTNLLGVLFFFGMVALGGWLYQLGRRLRQRTAAELTASDNRPPILLLRSFPDDRALTVHKSGLMAWSGLTAVTGQWVFFEEILARSLSAFGPVIAIGRPGESIPPLGAARTYVPAGADWRDEVRGLLDRCGWAVAVLGATEGLRWEFETVIEAGNPEKLLIVVPPVSSRFLAPRESMLRELIRERTGSDLPPLDPKTVLLRFSAGWVPQPTLDHDLRRDSIFRAMSRHQEKFLDKAFARLMKAEPPGIATEVAATEAGPGSGGSKATKIKVCSSMACLVLAVACCLSLLYGRGREEQLPGPGPVIEREPVRDIDSLVYDGRRLGDAIRSLENSEIFNTASIAETLGQIGPEAQAAVPRLIGVLRMRGPFAFLATGGLARIGKPAIPALIEALSSPTENIRAGAAQALARIGPYSAPAIPALIRVQRDVSYDVRSEATEALGKIGPAAIPALAEALRDENMEAREAAAEALGQLGPDAVPSLLEALKDSANRVRFAACQALGRIGPAAGPAVPALTLALVETDENLPWAAANALGQIGPGARSAVSHLLRALRQGPAMDRAQAADSLVKIDPAADGLADALASALTGNELEVRIAAARGLGRLGPSARPALDKLRHAARDADVELRAVAALAIWKVAGDTDAALRPLLQNLNDRTEGIGRTRSIDALLELGPAAAQAVPTLVDAWADAIRRTDYTDIADLNKILIGIGGAAVPAIRKLEQHPDARVRKSAASILTGIRTKAEQAVPNSRQP
jgi:HEAT repeat protein